MRKHFLLKHAPDEVRDSTKNHICPTCGKRFHGNNNLRYHMLTHTKERPFKCVQCGKGFRQQQALDVHHFRLHENVRNFACPHCPWKFKDAPSLKGHIAIHTGEKNNVCHICGVRTIHLHALKSHWRVHVKKGDWVEPPNFNVKKKWVRKKKVINLPQMTVNE
jgi:KRAB domain-containing zinc finger protein